MWSVAITSFGPTEWSELHKKNEAQKNGTTKKVEKADLDYGSDRKGVNKGLWIDDPEATENPIEPI